MRNSFKFTAPASIVKATDANGREVMRIAGIASTMDKDADGEFLDPRGFDLTYFLTSGQINWHHQLKTDPSAYIGVPTAASITPAGLYIEGELFPDSDNAVKVYNLAKTLASQGQGRKLSFSIEGKVLERDPANPNIVRRAQITGVAITPTPKNTNTFVDIIKGMVHDEDVEMAHDDLNNINPANGGSTYLIDITDGHRRITVDRDYNITITVLEKMITADAGGSALRREHLDGDERYLTKAEIQRQLLPYNSTLNVSQIMKKLTQKDLDQFLANFQPKSAANAPAPQDFVSKAMDCDDDDDDIIEKDEEEDDDENQDDEVVVKAIVGIIKKIDSLTSLVESVSDRIGDLEDRVSQSDAEIVQKGLTDDLGQKFQSIGVIAQGQREQIAGLESRIVEIADSLDVLIKGFPQVSSAVQSLPNLVQNVAGLQQELESIKNTPLPRKSITHAQILQKGFASQIDNPTDNRIRLGTKADRQQIINNLLEIGGFNGGTPNKNIGDALLKFESTGILTKAAVDELSRSGYAIIEE